MAKFVVEFTRICAGRVYSSTSTHEDSDPFIASLKANHTFREVVALVESGELDQDIEPVMVTMTNANTGIQHLHLLFD
jgi:hypothetical protein